jgi:hypothetical protein
MLCKQIRLAPQHQEGANSRGRSERHNCSIYLQDGAERGPSGAWRRPCQAAGTPQRCWLACGEAGSDCCQTEAPWHIGRNPCPFTAAAIASWLPARRAAALDPTAALRVSRFKSLSHACRFYSVQHRKARDCSAFLGLIETRPFLVACLQRHLGYCWPLSGRRRRIGDNIVRR